MDPKAEAGAAEANSDQAPGHLATPHERHHRQRLCLRHEECRYRHRIAAPSQSQLQSPPWKIGHQMLSLMISVMASKMTIRATKSSWQSILKRGAQSVAATTSQKMRKCSSWRTCNLAASTPLTHVGLVPAGEILATDRSTVKAFIEPTVVLVSVRADDSVIDRLDPEARNGGSVDGASTHGPAL